MLPIIRQCGRHALKYASPLLQINSELQQAQHAAANRWYSRFLQRPETHWVTEQLPRHKPDMWLQWARKNPSARKNNRCIGGCSQCSSVSTRVGSFKAHGKRYDYSTTRYTNSRFCLHCDRKSCAPIAKPSRRHCQYMQWQALMGKPSAELSQKQLHETHALQKKLGLCSIDSHSEMLPQKRSSEKHQLQLLIQSSPANGKQRWCSDQRRLQHLCCLPREWRKGLVNEVAAPGCEESLAFKFRIAEHKAEQLVHANRNRQRRKAQRPPGSGKAFTAIDLESEMAIANERYWP